jgi:photosystem II stability/assembly factor-like uncharacterized protein
MKKIIILFIAAFNFQPFTFNCLAQWFQQNSGTTAWLAGIHFVNASTGTAVGDSGIVIRTTNGGLTWSRQNSATQYVLLRVAFVNADWGTAVGGEIIHTINGGANWILQSAPGGPFQDLKLIDQNTGYTVTIGPGRIFKTTNGGNTWFELPQNLEPAAYWYGVDFIDANTGWVVGQYSVQPLSIPVLKTTNGGLNWGRTFSNFQTNSRLTSVSFGDALHGVIVGEGPRCVTTNGGVNWIYRGSGGLLRSVEMINQNIGYAVGFQRIWRTTDGGFNWEQQALPVNEYFYDVTFVDTNTGWVAGGNGTILHTTNGGISGIQPIGNKVPEKFQLYQNYPNPFNPRTKIKFDIPVETGLRPVSTRFVVYDVLGKEISILVNQQLHPGTYEVEFDGANHPSGVYFYRLETGNYRQTRKMILTR